MQRPSVSSGSEVSRSTGAVGGRSQASSNGVSTTQAVGRWEANRLAGLSIGTDNRAGKRRELADGLTRRRHTKVASGTIVECRTRVSITSGRGFLLTPALTSYPAQSTTVSVRAVIRERHVLSPSWITECVDTKHQLGIARGTRAERFAIRIALAWTGNSRDASEYRANECEMKSHDESPKRKWSKRRAKSSYEASNSSGAFA